MAENEGLRLREMGFILFPYLEGYDFRQPCSFLEDCACQVYPDRPNYCRNYQCKLLKRYLRGEIDEAVCRITIQRTQEISDRIRLQLLPDRPGFPVWKIIEAYQDWQAGKLKPKYLKDARAETINEIESLNVLLRKFIENHE